MHLYLKESMLYAVSILLNLPSRKQWTSQMTSILLHRCSKIWQYIIKQLRLPAFSKAYKFWSKKKSLRLHTKNSSSKAPWTYKIILGKMNQKATFHYRRRLWCCRTSRRKRGPAQSDRVQRKTEAAGSGPSTQTLSVSSQSWRGRPE